MWRVLFGGWSAGRIKNEPQNRFAGKNKGAGVEEQRQNTSVHKFGGPRMSWYKYGGVDRVFILFTFCLIGSFINNLPYKCDVLEILKNESSFGFPAVPVPPL